MILYFIVGISIGILFFLFGDRYVVQKQINSYNTDEARLAVIILSLSITVLWPIFIPILAAIFSIKFIYETLGKKLYNKFNQIMDNIENILRNK